ncbi:MAG: septum formation initiator family protein [Nocardioidaceae bacterium]
MAAASEQDDAAKPRLTGRAAILALVLAVLVVSYASSLRVWLEQRREISGLESQIAASKASVHQMRQEKARWHDPAYIEAQARERFAWVLPGQIGFTVIDGGQAGDGDPIDPTRPASAGGDWWQSAWGSVLAAGAEPKADAGAATSSRRPAHKIGPNAGAGHLTGSGGPGG